jgi:fructokinase
MFVVGGESLIDLVQEKPGPDGVVRMTAHAGGSPYNCAIALARLGNETGFLCPISKDGFGTYLLGPLEAAGVKPLLKDRVFEPTTLAVVTLDARMQAQYEFYRQADHAFSVEGLKAALPASPEVFQIGGFCPIEPEDAAAWLEVAAEAKARGATLTMDPNVRPSLVSDFSAYKTRLEPFFDLVNVVKVSIEDLLALVRGRATRPEEMTEREREEIVARYAEDFLSRPNCELLVVTFGEAGSRAFTRAGNATATIYSPPVFGDTVGAGDSLMAGIITDLSETGDLAPGRLAALDDARLARMLRFGAVVAGLNCAHKGCQPPTRPEVDAVLTRG